MNHLTRYGKAKKQKDGKYVFEFNDKKFFQEAFSETLGRGRDEVNIELEISEEQYGKTNEQLKYWKGPLLEVAYMGYRGIGYKLADKTEAEYVLKMAFWYKAISLKVVEFNSNFYQPDDMRIPKSLKNISKQEFTTLIDNAREFINEHLGVYLMSPEEWQEQLIDKETGEIL